MKTRPASGVWGRARLLVHVVPVTASAALVVSLVLAAGLVSSAAAHTSERVAVTGSMTFTDPTGDSQAAPDVTAVVINGDATTGTITFAVTVTGLDPPGADGLTRNVTVFLDTDKNGSTGSSSGSEFALTAGTDPTDRWWDMDRWDGSAWQSMPETPTMRFSRSGDVLNWTANKSDLGGTSGFAFYVSTSTRDSGGNASGQDAAPDSGPGQWTYDLSAAATTPPPTTTPTPDIRLTLAIGSPQVTPATAVAGKRFTVSFKTGFWSPPGDIRMFVGLSSGKIAQMTCDPSVAGKVIAHAESLKKGTARLSFVIPKSAKGKQLKVKVTVKATNVLDNKVQTVTRIASFRVK